MKTGERRPELDGVRGVAILLVLVGHAWPQQLAVLSAAGVTLFFALSGHLITGILLAEYRRHGRLDLRRFYARRMTRLAPPLFVMLAVVGVVGGLPWRELVAPALWLGNYARLNEGLPPALEHTWSLGVEEQFYLVFPLALLWLLRKRGAVVILVGVIGALVAWRLGLTVTGHAKYAYYASESAGIGLLVGCLTAFTRLTRGYLLAGVGWAAGVAALLVVSRASGDVLAMHVPLMVAPLAGTAVACAPRMRVVLAWRPLVFSGVASYSLYLWHVPVAWLLGGGHMTPLGVAAGALVGLVAYQLVEVPVMRWRSRPRARASVVAVPSEAALSR